MTLACVDVAYADDSAAAACLLFDAVSDARAKASHVVRLDHPAPYVPGRFYERELPPILQVLARVTAPLDVVFVDAHVWLGPERPGLGARLHAAIAVPVIGVAKTAFRGAPAIEVVRGRSARPLFVTSLGVDPDRAAALVRAMHGPSRIPTLLRDVDHLARATLRFTTDRAPGATPRARRR